MGNSAWAKTLEKLYKTMLRIRMVEQKIAEILPRGEIRCPAHLYIGQEAVAAGVCANLKKNDYVFSTHRNHGHYLAKGGDLRKLLAELFGKTAGCSKGKGGSMHVVAREVGILGTCAIVGGDIPLSVGSALASVLKPDGRVTVCFLGDGSSDEGVLYESLNFASLKNLPVIFICENNFYAIHLHQNKRQSNGLIYQKAAAFKVPAQRIDGNDVIKIYKAAQKVIDTARRGGGPAFLECVTYRCIGHVGHWLDDEIDDRKEEIKKWSQKCPIESLEKILFKEGYLSELQKVGIINNLKEEIEEALVFARGSTWPGEEELLTDVYKE